MTTERQVPGAHGVVGLCVALAGIYTVQSLVTGLVTQALPAVLRSAGASLQTTGLAFLALSPWVLKGLWAPWVERWRLPTASRQRRSRPLILWGQAVVVATLAAVALLGANLTAAIALLGVAALATATVDIAADGFAIDQLAPGQRGWGNVAQVGGSYAGIALGGSAFLLLHQRFGWAVASAAMAVLTLACTAPLWRLQEPPRPASTLSAPSHRATWCDAWQRPAMRYGLLLVVGLGLGVRLCLGMLGPWLIDQGVDMPQLATLWGVGGLCTGLAGTLAGGLLVQRLGAWRALHAALALEAVALSTLTACALLQPALPLLIAASAALLVAMACGFVTRYAWLMGLTSPRQPGLDFTLLQCTEAAVAMAAGVAGGWLAGHAGYGICFGLATSCGVFALALPRALRRRGQWGNNVLLPPASSPRTVFP